MIPDFIIDMFENEIRKVTNDVLEAVASKFKLDISLVKTYVEKHIQMNLQIVPDTYETIKITKIKPRPLPDDAVRCIARVKKTGIICQCTFQCITGNKHLCSRHTNKMLYGTINDPPVEEKRRRYTKLY